MVVAIHHESLRIPGGSGIHPTSAFYRLLGIAFKDFRLEMTRENLRRKAGHATPSECMVPV